MLRVKLPASLKLCRTRRRAGRMDTDLHGWEGIFLAACPAVTLAKEEAAETAEDFPTLGTPAVYITK